MKKPVILDAALLGSLSVGLPGTAAPIARVPFDENAFASTERFIQEIMKSIETVQKTVPDADSLFISLPSPICSQRLARGLREELEKRQLKFAIRCISTAAALLMAKGLITGGVWEAAWVSTIFEGGLFSCCPADSPGLFDGVEIQQFQVKSLLVPAGKQFEGSKKLKQVEYDPRADGFLGMSALASLSAWETAEDADALL